MNSALETVGSYDINAAKLDAAPRFFSIRAV
jgi:hypothetical protein